MRIVDMTTEIIDITIQQNNSMIAANAKVVELLQKKNELIAAIYC